MLRRRRAMVAAMGGGAVPEQTLTLQPGPATGKDNLLVSNVATSNFGNLNQVGVGEASTGVGQTTRTLIQFDLSPIDPGATIISATLKLYAEVDQSTVARTYRVYRMIQAWTEGDGTAGSGSTWNTYDGVNNWPGGAGGFGASDCEQTEIGSRAFTDTETLNEFKEFTLDPVEVQEWVSGAFANNGMMIKADTELNDKYVFASSDGATPENRPILEVVYTNP